MGCFEYTDWELFKSVCIDLDDLTETVTNYIVIIFCEDLIIKKKPCVLANVLMSMYFGLSPLEGSMCT